MNKRIGLYWQHDLDLVALKMHPDFNIGYWMKRALIAYTRGDEGFVIPLPRDMPYRVELDNCSTHFVLHPEKEADVIACLNGFRTGHVANAIKQIFRMYLEAPYLAPYYNDTMYAVKTRGRTSTVARNEQAVKPIVKRRVAPKPNIEAVRQVAPTPMPITEKPKVATEQFVKKEEPKHYQNKDIKKPVINRSEPSNEEFINNNAYSEATYSVPSYEEPEIEASNEDDGGDFDMFAMIDKMF